MATLGTIAIVAVPQPPGDGLLTLEIRPSYVADQCSVQSCYRQATTYTETSGVIVPLCYTHEQTLQIWASEPRTSARMNGHR